MTTADPEGRTGLRLAGSCGVLSAGLILAGPSLPQPVAVAAWILGFLLMLPFLAGVAAAVHGSGSRASWVAPVIPVSGAVLVAVHLVQLGIEYAANNLSTSSPAHDPLHDVGGALFMVAMLPFGTALLAIAIVGLANRALPRWLAGAALVIGVVALVNGAMLSSEMAWGFLLSTVWVFVAGVTLAVRGSRVVADAGAVTAAV
jgi:hypothetical protein